MHYGSVISIKGIAKIQQRNRASVSMCPHQYRPYQYFVWHSVAFLNGAIHIIKGRSELEYFCEIFVIFFMVNLFFLRCICVFFVLLDRAVILTFSPDMSSQFFERC